MTFISVEHSRGHFNIEQLPLSERLPDWHGAAFRLATSGRELIVLSGVSLTERGSAIESSPQPWGCEEVRSDGRFVVVDMREGERVRIGGRGSLVASSVHQ
jgi:hypothetical protein